MYKKKKRCRDFSLILYVKENELSNYLRLNYKDIKRYAYIFHDKDNKEPHIHLLLTFDREHTLAYVEKKFKLDEQNVMVEAVTSNYKMYRYLTHKDNPEKYQYNEEQIKTNDAEYYTEEIDSEGIAILGILDDMSNPFITYRTLIKRYGRDFVIHYKAYREMARLLATKAEPYKEILNMDNTEKYF